MIGFFIQPESAERCRIFTTLWRDDLAGDTSRMAEAVDFEVAVIREDLVVQEAFDELVLPLTPTAEVHTRADRTTLELRRVLSDLVAAAQGEDSMTGVTLLDHPVVEHRVATLRDKRTDRDTFRQLVSEISGFLAYEALRDLGTAAVLVDTPVADGAPGRKVIENVLVVPILRAGLGMVQAVQEIVPLTEVAHVGLRRDEQTLRSEVYLNRLPADLTGRRVVVCDPMLATGGSLVQVCDLAVERGAREVVVLCVIASVPGIAAFQAVHPAIALYCAAIDPDAQRGRATSFQGWATPGTGCSVRRTERGRRLYRPMSSCQSSGYAAMKVANSSVHPVSSRMMTSVPCSATQSWPPTKFSASPMTTVPIWNWRRRPLQYQQGERVVTITQSA